MKQKEDTFTMELDFGENSLSQPAPKPIEWTATRLRTSWAIRPAGALGTCGWIDGVPWTVRYVKRLPAGMRVEA